MKIPLIAFRSLVTLTLASACVILAVMWPGWLTAFRAEGSYQEIGVTGDLAVSTANVQNTNIGIRLGALRGGATGSSGLGASADTSRQLGGGLSLFLNGLGSFGDQDETGREPGFDFHTAGFTLGADYRLTNNVILGAAFGYLNSRAQIDDNAGHVTNNGYSLSAFGTYYIAKTMYVDAIATYTWNAYDLERNSGGGIFGTARAHPGGNQFALSVGSGYDFNFGPLTTGPTLRVNYLNVHIDGYRERGFPAGPCTGCDASTSNLKVNGQNPESLTTDLGGHVSYAISMPWGVLSPMARFEWEHEYKNDSRNVTGRSAATPGFAFSTKTNDPDRDYFNLGAGVSATFARGSSAFFYYETVVGRDNFTNHSFTAGMRFTFE